MQKQAIYLSCYDNDHENPPLAINGLGDELDEYSRALKEMQTEFRATIRRLFDLHLRWWSCPSHGAPSVRCQHTATVLVPEFILRPTAGFIPRYYRAAGELTYFVQMDRYRSDVDSVPPIPVDLEHQLRSPFAPQKAFHYPMVRWAKWLNDLDGIDEILTTLPAALDRSIAAERIDVLLDDDKTAAAFVVAMIWGHGSSGYGPFRTARILTGTADPAGKPLSSDILEKLTRSVDIAQSSGAVSGYRYLNNNGKITGLGPAFFTKWLYFVTARGNPTSPDAAPVLDALVIEWFRRHAHVRIRSGRTADYSAYLDHLTAWGTATDHTPVEVEERIFRLIRNDGTPQDSTIENDERTNHD